MTLSRLAIASSIAVLASAAASAHVPDIRMRASRLSTPSGRRGGAPSFDAGFGSDVESDFALACGEDFGLACGADFPLACGEGRAGAAASRAGGVRGFGSGVVGFGSGDGVPCASSWDMGTGLRAARAERGGGVELRA